MLFKQSSTLKRYRWEGMTQLGEKTQGILEAVNVADARKQLRHRVIIVRKICIIRVSWFSGYNKKITSKDITLFSRQMTAMISAGIALIHAFDIVHNGHTNQRMKTLIITLKNDVTHGLTLAEALRKHPVLFNPLFCNLVAAGELSGTLDVMLDKVATHNERMLSLKQKIKKTLTYPLAVLMLGLLITVGLLIIVVPQFESLFTRFGADLPAPTRGVIYVSDLLQSHWQSMALVITLACHGFVYARKHSTRVTLAVDQWILKFPIIGSLLQKIIISRFSSALSITFAAGLPLVDALKSVAGVTGNSLYAKATHEISLDVAHGHRLQFAMGNTTLFPHMVTQMVNIGEESGTLEQMLNKVTDYYTEQVDHAVDGLTSLLEPLIMTLLGLLVGGLVVAMYLPILKLGAVV